MAIHPAVAGTDVSGSTARPLLARVLDELPRRVRVDRSFDIPYLAGYSHDGRTVYIDRDLPSEFVAGGRVVDVDRYLVLHEVVEKALIDQFGLHYLHAHEVATQAEAAAVRGEGHSWRAYDAFTQVFVATARSKAALHLPPDLDRTPYEDARDQEVLQAMDRAGRA